MGASIPEICEKVKQGVGKTQLLPLGVIRQRDFQRFAVASGDLNPLYFDDSFAKASGRAKISAPPLFLSRVLVWEPGPFEQSLRPDGTAGQEIAQLPVEGLRLMGGGQDLEFHRPVTDGTEVTMELATESVELKEGRSGSFLIIKLRRRYLDRDDQTLMICRETFIAR